MKNQIVFGGLLLALFSSCTKEESEDTTAPSIVNATINGEDHDITVNTSEFLNFEIDLSDNEELGEIKIDIHDIFDDHSHGKKAATPWAHTQTYTISGTSQNFKTQILVDPSAAAGPYHSILRVIDESGNESDFKEIDFLISNGEEAQIAISSPDFDAGVNLNKGDSLIILGQITDNIDLTEILISLEEEGHDHGKKQEDALYEMDFDLLGSKDYSWDFQADGSVRIQIPTTAESGGYNFKVIAKDSDGNLNIFEGHVHIN